jgi:uracil-DNA glycosylase
MSNNLEFWKPIVGEAWYLNNQTMFDSPYMKEILAKVNQEYKQGTILPLQKDIFKAFRLTPFDKVRVVILGSSPYTTGPEDEPSATGLAFANPVDTLDLNPELKAIHRALEVSSYDGLKINFDITLEEWAEQGVLLLNTELTVNKYRPGSHSLLWDGFTKFIIQSLNKQKTGLHFVFWGDKVKKYSGLVNGIFHFTYEHSHPFKAMKIGQDWQCTHFNDINMNLIQTNGYESTIAW